MMPSALCIPESNTMYLKLSQIPMCVLSVGSRHAIQYHRQRKESAATQKGGGYKDKRRGRTLHLQTK